MILAADTFNYANRVLIIDLAFAESHSLRIERRILACHQIVKGGLCINGMYELAPVRLSWRRTYVNFTDAIDSMSSQRHIDKVVAPVTVAYGTLETPDFRRQTASSLRPSKRLASLYSSLKQRTTLTPRFANRSVTPMVQQVVPHWR